MLAWFIDWTTQLNQTNHLAFAVVTVVTMASIGVCIAMVAELVLKRLSAGKSGAAGDPHAGH
ncbi:hypothetical protein [Ideonella sp.]|jgi:hypothetical protein|uniref:hypothetical protein n=1 Tax=Ideonella sp. TaxID=1929293 RepID=UPI0035AE6A90